MRKRVMTTAGVLMVAAFVLERRGTVATGFENRDGKRVEGMGVTTSADVGDVFSIPANVTHGDSALETEAVAWLNIRWDVNWKQ
jgi:uncharacterized RmlC-like cupin family protein